MNPIPNQQTTVLASLLDGVDWNHVSTVLAADHAPN